MVKLYCMCILRKAAHTANIIADAYDVKSFSFFQRASVQEFMTFLAKTVVERTGLSTRQTVKEQEYMCHVFVRADALAGVVMTDDEYPKRAAHQLINKVLNEFDDRNPSWESRVEKGAITYAYPPLRDYLWQHRSPHMSNAITRIEEELDETKIILHKTISAVLERGEKLDDLVVKSEGLSIQSKAFYKTAKKTNSCCRIG